MLLLNLLGLHNDPDKFLLGMGLGFQFPLVVLTLVKLGILHYHQLAHFRRHVIVGAFILGAILTTPEVITQVAMAVPAKTPKTPKSTKTAGK